QQPLGKKFNGLAALLQSFRHVAKIEKAKRKIGIAGTIRRELWNEGGVFLDSLAWLAIRQIVAAPRTVLLAVTHSVEVLQGQLIVFFGILAAAHVRAGRGEAGI